MEAVSIALLAALSAAVAVLFVRTARAAARTEAELAAVRRVAEEHAARPAPEPPPPPPLEPLREELSGLLLELGGRVAALERAVAAIPRPEPPPAAVRVRVAEEVGPLLREAVEVIEARLADLGRELREHRERDSAETLRDALRARGFTAVEILEGPVADGPRAHAVVEARRNGMTFKGRVTMEGSRVVDQGLRPATSMFP